jgi:2-oxoglutarate dehydrogenase E2 component (dihydrolipoamide succinyltransferase)
METDMRVEVRVPRFGDSMDGSEVVEWFVDVGDTVVEGTPLVSIDTGKVVADVDAPVSGVLAEVVAPTGSSVDFGSLLGSIES